MSPEEMTQSLTDSHRGRAVVRSKGQSGGKSDPTPPTPNSKPEGPRVAPGVVVSPEPPHSAQEANALTLAQNPEDIADSKSLSQDAPYASPDYEMLELLGQGTYGVVYHAREKATGVDVAIKFFYHGAGLEWQLLQAEVKQLASLRADPGIIHLLDAEPEAEFPYYVMAYAEKGSLAQRLAPGPMPVSEALPLFRQVCETLAYVHAKGIRHCDLKPGNILLDARGRARVADFGQAHLSSDASPALGTFFYMAPEQADLTRQVPDTRWDVYGLGALLYAMLTGGPPRENSTLREEIANTAQLSHRLRCYRGYLEKAAEAKAHRDVPGVDRALAAIVDRCLAVDPNKRYRDAAAVLEALETRERRRRQRPVLIFALAAPLLLLAILSVVALWEAQMTLQNSRAALVEQVRKSDATAARLLAYKVQDQLKDVRDLVEKYAKHKGLPELIERNQEEPLKALLSDFNAESKNLLKDAGSHLKASGFRCFVLDANGKLLALVVHPLSEKSAKAVGKKLAHRDFFNGRHDYPEDEKGTFEPLRWSHVSQPFAGPNYENDGLLFCVSTPVWANANKVKVAGVLAAGIRVKDLTYWLKDVKINDGFAVLVNRYCNVLQHKENDKLSAGYQKRVPEWPCPVYQKALEGDGASGSAQMENDPVDGENYLVGYAPIALVADRRQADRHRDAPKVDWAALVQHNYASVTRPVDQLKRQIILYGCTFLVSAVLLLAGLWAGLFWMMRREGRIVPGKSMG